MGRSFDETMDPFARITAPPAGETPEQRRARESKEAEAKRISEQIDEALKAEREEGKAKRKHRLKILLLGQSESGTSNPSDLSLLSEAVCAALLRLYPTFFRPIGFFVTRISNILDRSGIPTRSWYLVVLQLRLC